MYENHRKSFYRDDRRDFDEDRFDEDRFRGDGRGWRSPYRSGRYEDEREWNSRNRAGYASTYRDDYGRYSGYGADRPGDYGRDGPERERQEGWAHDPRHAQHGQGAASYGYGAGQPYGGGEGDSRYFTGYQGSWAQPSSYGAKGARNLGADYRSHAYASRGHDEDERGFWDRASDEVASWFGDEEAAQRREFDHRGRGPKDYKRSDERIREDVNDRLTDDSRVDASNITLTVQNGEVTLNGTVAGRLEKRRSEDLVEQISGVGHVQNNLRVAEATTTGTAYGGGWTSERAGTAEGDTIGQAKVGTTAQGTKV